jgi:ATP-dependent Zn protease
MKKIKQASQTKLNNIVNSLRKHKQTSNFNDYKTMEEKNKALKSIVEYLKKNEKYCFKKKFRES